MTDRTWIEWLTERDGFSFRAVVRDLVARHGPWASWLVPAVYIGCLLTFIADLLSVDTVAFGVFYVPLVVTALFHRDRRAVWVLAAVACGMVIVGIFVPAVAADFRGLIWNRALSLGALLGTALFVRHARSIQDRLTEQTERAEIAERIKSEVLSNLSEEIRAPLYGMIGVLELAAADSRPDQKAALGMARSSARRLLTTIDNLVDLTQFEGDLPEAETIDLAALLRRIVDSARPDAAARQIGLTLDLPPGREAAVHASPWATRRILENKVADAIAYTPPGGHIDIGIAAERDHVAAVIATTGVWPANLLHTAGESDIASLTPSAMGLALSRRLARAMGAPLLFSNTTGAGTTVRLCLPGIAHEPEPA